MRQLRGALIVATVLVSVAGGLRLLGVVGEPSASAGSNADARFASTNVKVGATETATAVSVQAELDDEGVVDFDIGGGEPGRVRALVLDDRDRAALVSEWFASEAPGTLRVPTPMLAGGPVRVVTQIEDVSGQRSSGPSVLVSGRATPVEARIVRRVSGAGRRVALVFDDGIDAVAMRSIIATLRTERASATFCLNGSASDKWNDALRDDLRLALQEGRVELCSHGYGHRTGEATSLEDARIDLRLNVDELEGSLGATTRPLYRPPYGQLSDGLLRAAGELGYAYVLLWDVDPGDYLDQDPAALVQRVVRDARPGSITVLHILPRTAAALPDIIAELRVRGLEPVGAGRMLRAAGRRRAVRVGARPGDDLPELLPPEGESPQAGS